MSGGHFDYAQYHIVDIYNAIEAYLDGEPLEDDLEVEEYIRDHYLEDDEKEYIRKHHNTIPNNCEYSKETITEFRRAVRLLKRAEVYTQRIDWLLSGDDGEDTFHKRLKADLKKLKYHPERKVEFYFENYEQKE